MKRRSHWTIDGWIDMVFAKRLAVGTLAQGYGVGYRIVDGRHCVNVWRVMVVW